VPLLTKENALETIQSVRKTTRKREVWVELGKQAQYDFVHNAVIHAQTYASCFAQLDTTFTLFQREKKMDRKVCTSLYHIKTGSKEAAFFLILQTTQDAFPI